MKLHPIHHNQDSKNWCGPAALSIITGNPTDHSYAILRQVIQDEELRDARRVVIKGIRTSEMLKTLKQFLITAREVECRMTLSRREITTISLARFLLWKRPATGNLFLVIIPGHFLVTDGKEIADNNYRGPIHSYRWLDEEIRECYELTETEACEL